ncbi:hypothetical protein QU487_22395, partial [Crenobacter sp. SG2305]|uniref:hypothetical protein n=1 Tax=Crenobacter oryzisoli TaxID=3056844 RepID=UPI0025AB5106
GQLSPASKRCRGADGDGRKFRARRHAKNNACQTSVGNNQTASYTRADEAVLLTTAEESKDVVVPTDISRGRRLSSDEEAAVRHILDGEKPAGRQRPLELKWQGALELLFELALETAVLPVTRYIICM